MRGKLGQIGKTQSMQETRKTIFHPTIVKQSRRRGGHGETKEIYTKIKTNQSFSFCEVLVFYYNVRFFISINIGIIIKHYYCQGIFPRLA